MCFIEKDIEHTTCIIEIDMELAFHRNRYSTYIWIKTASSDERDWAPNSGSHATQESYDRLAVLRPPTRPPPVAVYPHSAVLFMLLLCSHYSLLWLIVNAGYLDFILVLFYTLIHVSWHSCGYFTHYLSLSILYTCVYLSPCMRAT